MRRKQIGAYLSILALTLPWDCTGMTAKSYVVSLVIDVIRYVKNNKSLHADLRNHIQNAQSTILSRS